MHWLSIHAFQLFDGIAALIVVGLGSFFLKRWFFPEKASAASPITAAVGGNGAVALGSNISQTVNSPTITDNSSRTVNLTLPAPPAADSYDRARYDEWRDLISELHEAFQQIGYAFYPINVISADGSNDYQAGIRRGFQVIRNRLLIAEALKRGNVLEKYGEIVRYASSAHNPRNPSQRGCPTVTGFDMKASAFEDELMKIAREDISKAPLTPLQRDERQQLLQELSACIDRMLRNCPALAYTVQGGPDWPEQQRKEFNDAALDGARAIGSKFYIADDLEKQRLLERWQLVYATSDAAEILERWTQLRDTLLMQSASA